MRLNFKKPQFNFRYYKIIFLTVLIASLLTQPLWAAKRTWDGGGSGNNWSTEDNWSGNSLPGSRDDAKFDDTSATDSIVDQSFTVKKLEIKSTYTGTITVSADLTVTGDFKQEDGFSTINLGSSTVTFEGKNFTVSGGTFTIGTSTVIFGGGGDTTLTYPGTPSFYNLQLDKTGKKLKLGGGTITVTNTLTLTDGKINTGTVNAQGDIIVGSAFDADSATLIINGTGDQTLTGGGSASTGKLLALEIDKSSGTLFLSSIIRTEKNWTYTQGTVDAGTSTVVFVKDLTITPGSMEFNNVTFNKNNKTFTIAGGHTMIINGTTTLTDGDIAGQISAKGNIVIGAGFEGGSGTISLTGTSDQTITCNSGGVFPDTLDINKSSGTVTITGTCSGIQDITVTQGTLDFAGGFTYTIDDADAITVASGASILFTGSSGSLVTLRSDSGASWDLNLDSGVSRYQADYVDASLSNATGRKIFASNSTDSGNNTNWFFVPGTLTGTNVEPASLVASASGLVTISFTTVNPIPLDGTIEIDFPSGFNGTGSDTVSSTSGIDGNFSIAVSNGDGTNDVITITRSGGTEVAAATAVSFQINSITNPGPAGSTGMYSIQDKDSKGGPVVIDQDTAVTADTIVADLISKIAFTTSSQTLTQHQVSSIITIQAQDSSDNSQNVSSDTIIDIASSSTGGSFSLNALAWESVNSVTIPSGDNSVSFYYKDSVVGTPTITASENPSQSWTDALQSYTINSAIDGFSVSISTPQIAGAEFTVTITAIDEDGNTLTAYSGTVNLSVDYISPASGSGALSVSSATSFVNGVASVTNQTFSDCGTITITAAESGDSTKTGTSGNVVSVPNDFLVEFTDLDQTTFHTVSRIFTLKVTARKSDSSACTNNTGAATLGFTEVSPATAQGGTVSPATVQGTDWANGIASFTSATYNKWGQINVTCTDNTLTTQTGTSKNVYFLPKDFSITLEDPPASRTFYYLDEYFDATVTARDNNNAAVSNYQGTISFSGTGFDFPGDYTFTQGDTGTRVFEEEIKGTRDGEGTIAVKDTTYTSIAGTSDQITVKEAAIKVHSTSGPVGSVDVVVTIVDSGGVQLSEDDATTFTVELIEPNANGTATSDATTYPHIMTAGNATIIVTDTESETVTVTAQSIPVLPSINGEVTFGTVSRAGLGINLYREIKGLEE